MLRRCIGAFLITIISADFDRDHSRMFTQHALYSACSRDTLHMYESPQQSPIHSFALVYRFIRWEIVAVAMAAVTKGETERSSGIEGEANDNGALSRAPCRRETR